MSLDESKGRWLARRDYQETGELNVKRYKNESIAVQHAYIAEAHKIRFPEIMGHHNEP